jgi:hypothetical protein
MGAWPEIQFDAYTQVPNVAFQSLLMLTVVEVRAHARSAKKPLSTEDQVIKRKNLAGELVEATREAASISQGESAPAATHRFPLPIDVDVRAVGAGTELSCAESRRG